jgi:GT2 family glycosyltransferase
MKEVPIVLTIGSARIDLIRQTLETLFKNTTVPHKLYIAGDNRGTTGYIITKNEIISTIKDYDYLVSIDDDVYLREGWLEKLIEAHEKNPDIWALSACGYSIRHTLLAERADVLITDGFLGACASFRKEYFDIYSKIPEVRVWDRYITERLREKNRLVGRLKDDTYVIHCGITRSDGYKYTGAWVNRVKELAKEYGVILR